MGRGRRWRCARRSAWPGLTPDDIGYVNAHATSTEVGDNAEINGIRNVFGDRGQTLAVSSTKSATGHMLGAAGAIEAVYLDPGAAPPDAAADAQPRRPGGGGGAVRPRAAQGQSRRRCKHVLSNSFGFGGVNASLVFSASLTDQPPWTQVTWPSAAASQLTCRWFSSRPDISKPSPVLAELEFLEVARGSPGRRSTRSP